MTTFTERVINELENNLHDAESEATSLAEQLCVANARSETQRMSIVELQRKISDLTAQVGNLQRRNDEIFVRHHVATMDRQHLISLATECINEARRKGLIEAEGLIQRHRELEEQTDIEMMRGVVDVYTRRINEIQLKTQAPVKLDTRELAERVPELPAKRKVVTSRSWWNVDTKGSLVLTKPLAVGDHRVVAGSKGGSYIIKHSSDKVYTCTCPAWQFSALPAEERTCKHLAANLGVDFEAKRVEDAIAAKQKSCWCGVLLVNGQCQVHTNNWRGEERCNCGRLFSFCKEEYTTGRSVTKAWHTPRLVGTPEPVKH